MTDVVADETLVEYQLRQINRKLVLGQAWYPNTPYPGVKRVAAALTKTYGTADKATAKIVGDDGLLHEMIVNAIHSHYVVVERPNGKGGHTYPFYSYEHVEYPPGSTAARAIASNDAQMLYPIDEKMGKSKKEKQEALRRAYVVDHWQDHYDGVVLGIKEWKERQKRPVPTYENIHRQLIQNIDKVYRWVLKFEIKWDDKRTIVLDTYDKVAPMIKEMQKKFRSYELCNWSLTYEVITEYRMPLNVKPIR